MTFTEALFLGLVQGVTEFLPVSSSGHLAFFQNVLGISAPPLGFNVAVHLATLGAVVVFFRRELWNLDSNQLKLIAIGSVPAAIVGVYLEPLIILAFESLWAIGFGFLITAFILHQTKNIPITQTSKSLTFRDALIIGLVQALAILPGISRSGSTVSAALVRGINRSQAFTFSFLLSIPAILGAILVQLRDLEMILSAGYLTLAAAMIAASLSGFFSLSILKKIIESTKLHYFTPYLIIIATISLLIALT
jgi:undecaprenyl-diphosphatase